MCHLCAINRFDTLLLYGLFVNLKYKYTMRHFSVFIGYLFPLIFMGCKVEEDSYPPIHYGYNLAFVDENGNDLIEGMQTGLGRNGKLL